MEWETASNFRGLNGDTMYETQHDIQQKLVGTIILYNGEPVQVASCGHDCAYKEAGEYKWKIWIKNLISEEAQRINVDDPGLDFRGISSRLGYINCDFPQQDCVWISRLPIRKVIQGLNSYNCVIPHFPKKHGDAHANLLHWNTMLLQKGFIHMIKETYPSLLTARKAITQGYLGVAISRNIAVSKRDPNGPFLLEYKGVPVGESLEAKVFLLHPKYDYLMEVMEHHGLKMLTGSLKAA